MRKTAWIGLSIVLLLILLVLSPLCIGFYAKNKLLAEIDKLQEHNPLLIVRVNDYQRHWFTSTATIQIELNPNKVNSGKNVSIPSPLGAALHARIEHGPIFWHQSPERHFHPGFGLAYASGLLQLNNDSVPIVQHWLNRADLASIGVKFHFSGSVRVSLQWLPFILTDAHHSVSLNTEGGTTQWWVNSEVTRIHFEQSNRGLLLKIPELEAQFEQPTVLKVEQHKVNDKAWVGNVEMTIPSLRMQVPEQAPLRVEGIQLSYNTALKDNFLDTKAMIHINNVKRGDEEAYRGLAIEASADHLSFSALQAIVQLSQQLNMASAEMNDLAAKPGQTGSADNTQNNPAKTAYLEKSKQVFLLQQQGLLAITDLLREGAVFSVKQLHLGTQQGDVDGAISIAFPKVGTDQPLQGLVQVMNNAAIHLNVAVPKTLMQNVLTNVINIQNAAVLPRQAASVPPAAAQQPQQIASGLLAQLLAQGILLNQNDRYVLVFDYQDKKLQLNHQQTSILELIKKLSLASAGMTPPPK